MASKYEVRSGPLDLIQKGAMKRVKSYYVILISTSNSGVARLEFYDNHAHSLTLQPVLMVVGKEVIKVEKVKYKEKENAFLISTKDHHYTFLTKTPCDCADWVKSIQDTLLGAQDSKCYSERNTLYGSVEGNLPQNKEFIVKIHEDTKEDLHCKGNVKLTVENGSIIISSLPGKKLMDWNIPHIRRYGRESNNIFLLEAGRKSRLEGCFKFVTNQAENIILAIKTIENQRVTGSGAGNSPTSKVFNSAPHSLIAKMPPAQDMDGHLYEDFDMLPAANTNKPQGTQKKVEVQVPQSSMTSDVHKHQDIESGMPNCEPTYDDPVIITDAWRSNGFDEELYSTLDFGNTDNPKPQGEVEEDHYWLGEPVSQQDGDPIYAVIDPSKKKK